MISKLECGKNSCVESYSAIAFFRDVLSRLPFKKPISIAMGYFWEKGGSGLGEKKRKEKEEEKENYYRTDENFIIL